MHYIDAFVSFVDLAKLGFAVQTIKSEGRPSYDSKMILKIYLYGHLNATRSSRKLEKECFRNIEMQWLLENIHEGYNYIVDIYLKTFFDEVDHCLLMNLIYQKVKCPTTLRLIRKWLRVPILIKGKLVKRRKGVAQGSPISPLLLNILLHELDKELMRKGLNFVRYADDFSIYTKSKTQAKTVGNAIFLFLRDKLKLTINLEKSGVRKPIQFTILGFSFVSTYKKGIKGRYQLTVGDKAWAKLKQCLKEVTCKTAHKSFEERIL